MTHAEAMKLARDLKDEYLADMTADDLYMFCNALIGSDMKREIENAAYRKAAELMPAYLLNAGVGSSTIRRGARDKILSLILPPTQKEGGAKPTA